MNEERMKCLDTSVLLYAADKGSPFHRRAVELIEQSVGGKWLACVCEQSLQDFVTVVTSAAHVESPMTPAAALKVVEKLLRYPQPEVLYSDDNILRRALRLMDRYPSLRRRFGEAHIAATMLAHGVKTLVTADSQTYVPVRELDVENPFEALFA
jgi:toxin-antitoxin system PIN domain toxin